MRFLHRFGDDLVESEVVGLAEVLLVILTLAGTLSLAFGPVSLKPTAAIIALAGIFTLSALVIAVRVAFRRRIMIDRTLLSRYCEMLIDGDQEWRLLKWEQRTVVNPQGDVRQTMIASCVVRSLKLGYYRIRVGAGWDQPRKYQRYVRVRVRSLYLEDVDDPAAEVTQVWLPDGKLEVLVHFSRAISRGRRFRVVVELDWPGKCRPLMKDGVSDEFRYLASRFLEELAYTLVLPPESEVTCVPVGFEMSDPTCSLKARRNIRGQLELMLRAVDVKPPRTIGMRIEMK